jgi:putative hydrolase of the HAD superfamily
VRYSVSTLAGRPRHLECALFDLDNTLYAKSTGVMDVVSQRINEYMALRLGMDEATIKTLRPRYWEQYGTTMRGLMLEHGTNADDYLDYVHAFSVQEFLAPNVELDAVLQQLPWRKVIFTSSTRNHVQQVLEALAIAQYFARTFDIRDTGLICKPDPAAYQVVLQALGLKAEQCLLVDDSLPNLQTAAALGMVTVWVGSQERADGVTWAIDRIECIADVARAHSQEEGEKKNHA